MLSRVEPAPPAFQRVARQAWAICRVRAALVSLLRALLPVAVTLRLEETFLPAARLVFRLVLPEALPICRVKLEALVFHLARVPVPCRLRALLETFHLLFRLHLQAAGMTQVAAMFCLAQSARTARRRGAS